MSRGSLLVFSGLDGAGKSTQIGLLTQRLETAGLRSVYLWTRGGYTPCFSFLKACLRMVLGRRVVPVPGRSREREVAFKNRLVRRWWLRLAMIDLAWTLGVRVRWLRARGKIVICDRYLADTMVDFRLNFASDRVEEMWLWQLLRRITATPDAAFLLLVPVEQSLRRSRIKGEPFPDNAEVLEKRLKHYRDFAGADGYRVLDGERDPQALADDIWAIISETPSHARRSAARARAA